MADEVILKVADREAGLGALRNTHIMRYSIQFAVDKPGAHELILDFNELTMEVVPQDKYRVHCDNIGQVYAGGDRAEAERVYAVYVEQSKSEVGRAGGENVYLMEDDDIAQEHEGTLRQNDE